MKANNFDDKYIYELLDNYLCQNEEQRELKKHFDTFVNSFSCGLDELMSDILTQLRSITSAEAASLYVVDREKLRFVCVQNSVLGDVTSAVDENGQNVFLGRTAPLGPDSICGYVAKSGQPLSIADVRKVSDRLPYRYCDEFDLRSGYRTISLLTVPIIEKGEAVAILQLINHRDEEGEVGAFEEWMLGYVMLVSKHFLTMLTPSFDRYRERRESLGPEGLLLSVDRAYDSIMSQLIDPQPDRRQRNLPWLTESGISWSPRDRTKESNISKRLLAFGHYINQFDDMNTVIELMLTEARDSTRADAGTFYLVVNGGDMLKFAYVQNDTLFTDQSQRHNYVNVEMPISETSISGYVALSKASLNIPDVEHLKASVPYSFNRSFDNSSGYRTVSMLTVPVIGSGGAVVAVLQLINSLDRNGNPKAFDESDVRYADLLAGQSMPYLTRSIMTRRLLDSMLAMSNLRDPHETGAHVHRVGSFAAEIYHSWATRAGLDSETIRVEKDTLRLAAMLHDVGKVAVPDAVLKKPGKLDDQEYEIMKTHCAKGASMYKGAETRLERMAYEITLHHHQRWDGRGYTGDPEIPILAGDVIPLHARITSVADVLDALVSPRVYKSAWTFDDAIDEIRKCSGGQFDPEVVDATLDIIDTLKAIKEAFAG